jgi:hypothetical protein
VFDLRFFRNETIFQLFFEIDIVEKKNVLSLRSLSEDK